MKACRILYLVGELGLGGLQRQLCALLERMDRNRYRPAVAVWNFNEDEPYVREIRKLGVPLHCVSGKQSRLSKLWAFRRLVQQLKSEVVHSYSFYTNFAAFLATVGTKTISIGSVRSNFNRDKKNSGPVLGNLNARWPRYSIFNSSASAQNARHSKSLFVPPQMLVVRNGLDLQRFQISPLSNSGPVRIVGVGSLLPDKRWDRLLRATSELKKRGLNFEVKIAGTGPLKQELEQEARELTLNDHVSFVGHTKDIPKFLSNSTFLVHTSDAEGCPNAVMEAMACGRAVVATDAGEVPFLVDDRKTGFVVPLGDDAALVEQLAKLITDHELSAQLGIAGRAKAEREFGADRLVAETLAAYRNAGWRDS
jgi:glycosyltransferase involved in cell wall biosynthesis